MANAKKHKDREINSQPENRPIFASVILFGGTIALFLALGASVSLGASEIDFKTVWSAIFQFNSELTSHQIIQEVRLPRAISGALVGAFLAVSGALLQGITRNPLAAPSIMGITDGAAFALAIVFSFFPTTGYSMIMFWAFLGAGLGTILVFGIGALAKGGLTPVKLALAGIAVGALLSSLASGIAIYNQVAQNMSFWYAGGLVGTQWISIKLLLPVGIIGLGIAFILAHSITVLNLGEDVAKGLGQRTFFVKGLAIIVVMLLTGASVSVAGAIGFIGLVIPHITRFLVGTDYRWVIPCASILGAILLVLADIGARMLNPPFETPVGAITAVIGVPFFLYLARKGGNA
ncbi:FecCD family ABC transporter permease [Aquibacillus saliphilus]|uniref:FecCD family ABC transporter permease n=1 Tax=Aquibacillus saliphilus TaxID=1909422 RepID=UPI001CF03873|nr:iron ABC transporter permease [Aquibacillus saliphilus]